MWLVAFFIVSLIVSLYMVSQMSQKQEQGGPQDEADIPKASESECIPIIYGCRWIKSSGVVDYGDYRTKAITRST